MKNKYIPSIFYFLLAFVWSSHSYAGDRVSEFWAGYFEYSNSFWDGSQSVITNLRLKISPYGGCEISREGFQSDDTIICSVKEAAHGDEIGIRFVSYANGDVKNEYGVQPYRKMAPLFYLKKSGVSGVVTVWGRSYKPPKVKVAGEYFEKVSEIKFVK